MIKEDQGEYITIRHHLPSNIHASLSKPLCERLLTVGPCRDVTCLQIDCLLRTQLPDLWSGQVPPYMYFVDFSFQLLLPKPDPQTLHRHVFFF